MPTLKDLQIWMLDRITEAAPQAGVGKPMPLKDTPSLPAQRGLAVYRHAYQERLLECMRKEYPVLAQTLGGELFGEFARAYLRAYPPRSSSLACLGDRFVSHLAETRPQRPGGDGSDWTDLIIDLAALERAFTVAFDAPEETLPLRLACRYPVHRYFQTVRAGKNAELPAAPEETALELDRTGDRVTISVTAGTDAGRGSDLLGSEVRTSPWHLGDPV